MRTFGHSYPATLLWTWERCMVQQKRSDLATKPIFDRLRISNTIYSTVQHFLILFLLVSTQMSTFLCLFLSLSYSLSFLLKKISRTVKRLTWWLYLFLLPEAPSSLSSQDCPTAGTGKEAAGHGYGNCPANRGRKLVSKTGFKDTVSSFFRSLS